MQLQLLVHAEPLSPLLLWDQGLSASHLHCAPPQLLCLTHSLTILCSWPDTSCLQLGFSHPKLLADVVNASRARATEFTTPEAARLLHGLAMLRHRPEGLVPPLAAHLQGRLEECTDPDDFTILIQSLGQLQMEPGGWVHAACGLWRAGLCTTEEGMLLGGACALACLPVSGQVRRPSAL